MAKILASLFMACSLVAVLSFIGGSVAYGIFSVITGLVGCFIGWAFEGTDRVARKRGNHRVGLVGREF